MTGLNDKSAELITLLTATNTKLDAVADLLTALAPAAPPDFSDLLTAMQGVHTDTTAIAASAELIQGNTYDTIGVVADTRGVLETLTSYIGHDGAAPTGTTINTILQDIRRNNLNQMQGIIQAVILAACPCDPIPLYLPPPPTTVPFPGSDSDKCKRVQKVLAVFTAYIDNVANVSSIGAGLTQPGLAAAITAACTAGGITGAEVGILAGPPGAVIGAVIGALSLALAAVGSALMSTLSVQWHTAPLISQLQEGLFNAVDSEHGLYEFLSIVENSDVLSWYWIPVIQYMWWSAWSDLIYDETIELDLTGFDGTLCGQDIEETFTECVEFDSTSTTYTTSEGTNIALEALPFGAIPGFGLADSFSYGGGGAWEAFAAPNCFLTGALTGVILRLVSGTAPVTVIWYTTGGGRDYVALSDFVTTLTLPANTIGVMVSDNNGQTFRLEVCPPA
jgi:hypothetical protein